MVSKDDIVAQSDSAFITGIKSANLKGIPLRLESSRLTLVCGPSGSGKSALVAGTLEYEARRTLLPLLQSGRGAAPHCIADFESVETISPVINVSRFVESNRSSRSLGDFLGIYNFIAKLSARYARPLHLGTQEVLLDGRPQQLAERLLADYLPKHEGEFLYITGEIPLEGVEPRQLLEYLLELQRQGYRRFVIGSGLKKLPVLSEQPTESDLKERAEFFAEVDSLAAAYLYVVIDRVAIGSAAQMRLAESIATSLDQASGLGTVFFGSDGNLKDGDLKDGDLKPVARAGRGFVGLNIADLEPLRSAPWFAELLCGRLAERTKVEFELFGKRLSQLSQSSIEALIEWVRKDVHPRLDEKERRWLDPWIPRLQRVARYSPGRVSLGRAMSELSSGERFFATLCALSDAGSSELIFVFDEPSSRLHPADFELLLDCLEDLLRESNSVVLIEKTPPARLGNERVIALGPSAGESGGEIVFDGKAKLCPTPKGADLGKAPIGQEGEGLGVYMLEDQQEEIRSGGFYLLVGKSGAGKSKFFEQLASKKQAKPRRKIHFISAEKKARAGKNKVVLDLLGVDKELAKLYSGLPRARRSGFDETYFMLQRELGRCPLCRGTGQTTVALELLGSGVELCERCLGQRFQAKVLEVTYQDRAISDALRCSIAEATSLFSSQPALAASFQLAERLGLGHLALGLSAESLNSYQLARIDLVRVFSSLSDKRSSILLLDSVIAGVDETHLESLIHVVTSYLSRGHAVILSSFENRFLPLAHRIFLAESVQESLKPISVAEGEKMLAATSF